MSKRQLPLTEVERDELATAVRIRRNNWVTYAPYLDMIGQALAHADLLPDARWYGAATLGSVVNVRPAYRPAGQTTRWLLVPPSEDDDESGRLSVLTPLGWELLGARQGDTVYPAVADGTHAYVVERVLPPPVLDEPARKRHPDLVRTGTW